MIFKRIKPPVLRYILIASVLLLTLSAVFLMSIYLGAWGELPGKKSLAEFQHPRASEIYSSDSILIGKFYLNDRQPILYQNIPEHLINALIAVEDERFFEHSGVDYKSLLRVIVKTILLQDKASGGGSTISQQLAKNLYPRSRKGTFYLAIDKIKEMIIASRLEAIYSKEEVLEQYLNTVSFGDNTFGIESASLKFFGKRASTLATEEAAVLVAMLKATYTYNPRVFPDNSLQRRNLVLNAMEENEFIKSSEKDSLVKLPLIINYNSYDHNQGVAPYFREEVRKQVLEWCKRQNEEGHSYNIYASGLKIYTTLDYRMQVLAEEAMKKHMKVLQRSFEKSYGNRAPWLIDRELIRKTVMKSSAYKNLIQQGMNEQQAWDTLSLRKSMTLSSWEGKSEQKYSSIDSIKHYMKFINTGSISIDATSGAVMTWIGGVDYTVYKYDHISQSRRQVGSTFKPIVYSAALENGLKPCTYFSAEEVAYNNLDDWSPSNSGNEDETFMNYSMEQALSNSVNTVAVKVLEKTGIPNVLDQAKIMGITASLPNLPSLALGTGEIGVDEMAGAYASYLNDGKAVKPILIRSINNYQDSLLTTFRPKISEVRAFSEVNRQIMLEFMKATIDKGTGARIRNTYGLKNDIAGKTGTTQNNKDAWFVALTPKLVHVTWVGLDNHEIGFKNTSLGQGASAALPIFALWMQKLNSDASFNYITKARFKKPNDAVLSLLDCEPVKRDGFFKRLFKNPNKKRSKKFKQ
ncbi:transglycosylase domain-containing protein [uncultured Eudoraea sp.]|uniref:transglycosylase domain-containing protein n=1 Tax=uncultured Eudoraea sp. TaxID=1035614 RepID=UPI00262019D8|nr:transglycosylase domain-containing protein [uncultured Eudoraea sp.]